jgi:peptidoglycan/xylan/chitin deacetylase (PgdA/CDA1 family)
VIASQMKSLLKQFASPVLDRLGLYDRQLRAMRADSWTIVMYHRVIDEPADDPFRLGMCVTRRHFAEQLAYFRTQFTPIGLGEAAARLQRGEPLPPRALSISFDDGYLDNLTIALPELQAQGLGATLFVPTGEIDDDRPLWWDRVIHVLDATDAPFLVPAEFGIPLADERLSLGRWQRARTVASVLDALWTLGHDRVLDTIARLERALPPARRVAPVARRMNSAQLCELHRAGIELGAHSVRHSNLRLETPAVVRQEMLTSKRELERLCDAPISGFAYPAGWKNADTEAAARECGFTYAVSTVNGINAPGADLYTLRRVGMPDTAVADLKRALVPVIQRSSSRDAQG